MPVSQALPLPPDRDAVKPYYNSNMAGCRGFFMKKKGGAAAAPVNEL